MKNRQPLPVLRSIADAVFSGSEARLEGVSRLFSSNGWHRPHLYARLGSGSEQRSGGSEPSLGATGILETHPGFQWVIGGGRSTETGTVGKLVVCEGPDDFIPALRRSVTSLRDAECRALGFADDVPSVDEVRAARGSLLAALASGGVDCSGVIDFFAEIAIRRHRGYLNDLRRRLLEAIAQATVGHESTARIPAAFAQAVQGIMGSWTITDLHRATRLALRRIAEGLAQEPMEKRVLSPLIHRAVSLVRDPGVHGSVSSIARALSVTPSYLSRRFRSETGQTVLTCLQEARIDRARQLLSSNSGSLLSIAMESGFGSVEQFHRIFKRVVGTTPQTYRRRFADID